MSSYTVWKTEIRQSINKISVPRGAEFLCMKSQLGVHCVWYRCDPSKPVEDRWIAITLTGSEAPPPDKGRYLGTSLSRDETYVAHAWELVV